MGIADLHATAASRPENVMVEYFRLNRPDDDRVVVDYDYERVEFDVVVCPENPLHRRPGRRLTSLYVKAQTAPTTDFLWVYGGPCIISKRAIDVLNANSITGFATKPAYIKHDGRECPSGQYSELVIEGWAGIARPESGIMLRHYHKCCDSINYSGLSDPEQLIDWSQYDGSDFFVVWPQPRIILVTARVVESLRAADMSGYSVEDRSTLKWDFGYSPGPPEYSLSADRADKVRRTLSMP